MITRPQHMFFFLFHLFDFAQTTYWSVYLVNLCRCSCCLILRYFSCAVSIACSRAYILFSKDCKSWATWNLYNKSRGGGFILNNPPKVRTRDNTTYIPFYMNDQDTTIDLYFYVPCSLWCIVTSFLLIGNWVMLTPFNSVRGITLSYRTTCDIVVDFFMREPQTLHVL